MPTLLPNQLLFKNIWYLTKIGINLVLSLHGTKPPSPAARLPQELVDEIISYFFDNIRILLACSLTCRSWYIATVRHLHHSLTTDDDPVFLWNRRLQWPRPLKKKYKLGLLPCVKRFRIRMARRDTAGFTPERLDKHNLRYFSALKNLQELGIDDLHVSSFMPNLKRCFGHLSPTLRFLALKSPKGSSREIVYFIGLFPHLQDLKLHYPFLRYGEEETADTTLVPLCSPPLRGWLTLTSFTREQIVKDMITLFGGLRFHQMDLFEVKCLPLLLEKCAETLETLRLYPTDPYGDVLFFKGEEVDSTWLSVEKGFGFRFDLSQNKALRTLETTATSIASAGGTAPEFLKTVLSSVTSPGLLDVVVIYRYRDLGGFGHCPTCSPDPVCFRHYFVFPLEHFQIQLRAIREMHNARKFQLVFCADVLGCMEDIGMLRLGSAVRKEEKNGGFEYLACRPAVICEERTARTRLNDFYPGDFSESCNSSVL